MRCWRSERDKSREQQSPGECIIHPGAPWPWDEWIFNGVSLGRCVALFDEVKTPYSSLESNSSRPGHHGKMGKVSTTECRAWPVGHQETPSGQFCATTYRYNKSHEFCMFHHLFSLTWFCDVLKLLYVKEEVWKRGLWCWQIINRPSLSVLIILKCCYCSLSFLLKWLRNPILTNFYWNNTGAGIMAMLYLQNQQQRQNLHVGFPFLWTGTQ